MMVQWETTKMRIPIDLARFERDLNDLAAIGATAQGGVTRRSFTPADQTGRAFVERRMMDAGLRTWVDAAGNIHGRRPGKWDGPPVMMGSHVDTVENGGRYDGAVGILGAIEVIRALEDAACDELSSLEVVCFHAEEPSRFGFSCFGSKVMAGTLCDPDILDRCDPDGRSLAEALVEMGRDPARLGEARQSPGDIAAYVVPGFAEIYFEVRGRVHYPKSRPMAEIREALEGIGRRRGVGVVVETLMEDEARAMSPGILALIQRCAEDRGVPYLLMPSRTGHDALQLGAVTK